VYPPLGGVDRFRGVAQFSIKSRSSFLIGVTHHALPPLGKNRQLSSARMVSWCARVTSRLCLRYSNEICHLPHRDYLRRGSAKTVSAATWTEISTICSASPPWRALRGGTGPLELQCRCRGYCSTNHRPQPGHFMISLGLCDAVGIGVNRVCLIQFTFQQCTATIVFSGSQEGATWRQVL
jgi:hypothetical protein